ncbi:cytochrome c oxidase subunit NDUFA4-like [Rhopalosiphum maidis]|uniref:cytochrome c oxidase subunit NDUFA4-like n=1 Tax=Rhopalosiphum maidis TaxID=43146 RepID=UPI000F0031BD|nr:cytochrome c oxidase subunit NDUFA4-like [Rhopalosiphum maidis]XP_026812733.1 cytochrome c oxidase subunit NDUFA4-like [Rhopalosiphum maidis]XP_060840358.1 cytochrome c oxidase subunit NDUFA4 [Rhopalosiphum padi]
MVMPGMTIESLKKHKSLIPLFFCLGIGMAGAGFYLTRLAMKSPEVTWHPKKNQEPWEEYKQKTYKFYSTSSDPPVSPAPKY